MPTVRVEIYIVGLPVTSKLTAYSGQVQKLLQFIQIGVKAGASANELYSIAQAQGAGARRKEFLLAVKDVVEDAAKSQRIRHVNDRFYPSEDMASLVRTELRDNYSYQVQVTGRSSETGEKVTRKLTVTSTRALRIGEVKDDIEEALTNAERYDLEEITVMVIGFKHR
ncbi:MAG: hypothetical protein Q7N50_04015 [Armatimonadota bacterium]|nr:hypothetical protein [Armatimonadota bacterium]